MAAFWVLAGLVAVVGVDGISRGGIVLIPIGIAFVRWPSVLRWPMMAVLVLAPVFFVSLAHWYFHAVTNYPLIGCCCLGIVGHALLLFGCMTSARLIAGGVGLLASLVAARDAKANSPLVPAVCDARIEAMGRRVEGFRLAPSLDVQRVLHGAKLPSLRGRPRATASDPILEVAPTGIWFGRRLSDDVSRAALELRAGVERLSALANADEPVELYLAVDARARVSKIAPLLAPLRHVRVLLLGRTDAGPLGSPPASAKALADSLDRAPDETESARLIANELGRRAGPCAPLAKRLIRLNDLPDPSRRPALLVKALDDGLRECRCSWVDIDGLEYLVMRALGAPSTDYGTITIPQDESDHPTIPSQSDLTVEEWVQRL